MTPETSQPAIIQPIVPQSRTPPNCSFGLDNWRMASDVLSPYPGAVISQYIRKSANSDHTPLKTPSAGPPESPIPSHR